MPTRAAAPFHLNTKVGYAAETFFAMIKKNDVARIAGRHAYDLPPGSLPSVRRSGAGDGHEPDEGALASARATLGRRAFVRDDATSRRLGNISHGDTAYALCFLLVVMRITRTREYAEILAQPAPWAAT